MNTLHFTSFHIHYSASHHNTPHHTTPQHTTPHHTSYILPHFTYITVHHTTPHHTTPHHTTHHTPKTYFAITVFQISRSLSTSWIVDGVAKTVNTRSSRGWIFRKHIDTASQSVQTEHTSLPNVTRSFMLGIYQTFRHQLSDDLNTKHENLCNNWKRCVFCSNGLWKVLPRALSTVHTATHSP